VLLALFYLMLPGRLAVLMRDVMFTSMLTCALLVVLGRALPYVFQLLVKSVHKPRDLEETPAKQLEARLGLDPKNVNLLEMLAYTRYAAGNPDAARELYERALSIQPDHPWMRLQLGKCLDRLGRQEDALREFQTVAGHPSNLGAAQQAQFWIGVLERRGEEEEK
jgi:tetratricopeptide (TPR) repeat protein